MKVDIPRRRRRHARLQAHAQPPVNTFVISSAAHDLKRQSRPAGIRHADHVPRRRKRDIDREQRLRLGPQRKPGPHLPIPLFQQKKLIRRRLESRGRLLKPRPHVELARAARRVIRRHRTHPRGSRQRFQQRRRKGSAQHTRIDRQQSFGLQRANLEPLLQEQANHGHLTHHLQRPQLRQRPVREPGRRAYRGKRDYHRISRWLAQCELQRTRRASGIHGPVRQQWRLDVRQLEPIRQGEPKTLHGPVQHGHRERRVQPLISLRDLVHLHATRDHHTPRLQ